MAAIVFQRGNGQEFPVSALRLVSAFCTDHDGVTKPLTESASTFSLSGNEGQSRFTVPKNLQTRGAYRPFLAGVSSDGHYTVFREFIKTMPLMVEGSTFSFDAPFNGPA